jgi:hypothetical protein
MDKKSKTGRSQEVCSVNGSIEITLEILLFMIEVVYCAECGLPPEYW